MKLLVTDKKLFKGTVTLFYHQFKKLKTANASVETLNNGLVLLPKTVALHWH